MNTAELHQHTPSLAVIDPRGLTARGVAYWREAVGQAARAQSTRQVFDGVGHLAEQWDARLAVAALGRCSSLSGKVLASDSVDAGWRVSLFGEADQVLSGWDGRGSQGDIEYDASMRSVAVTEQGRVVERFEYGDVDASVANQCGRVVRHDDPAGTRHMTEYDLLGLSQCEVSHFFYALDSPDWPLDVAARNALLESDPGLASRWAYSALGDLLSLTDAHGHRCSFNYLVAGQLGQGWLQTVNTPAPGECLVQDIRYNPSGKVERETAGNGVVTLAKYALSDGRLERLSAGMPNAEPLQDLRYTVDPVGNVVQIDDHALPIRYFKNQRIDPQRVYAYDTLGQLISATGWETASPGAVLNYSEEYAYDAGSNMTELRHVGAQTFTRRWKVAPDSNRSLLEDDQPVDFPSHFDANGNLQYLQRGQTMTWDLRNQLASVSPVVREEEDDDTERYIYGGGGKRLRKVRTTLTNATTVIAEVRYLPGLELHRRPTGEHYQVLDLEAGRNRITWFLGPEAPQHPLRYHLTDHLGSGTLEVDEQGNVQSREDYYPFGGTASEDHSDQTGAYKTIRYSGKQRDATGLYYYGFRYYAPWLSRWINPDPAGAVDGLNFYCFVRNSPMTRWDPDGRDSDREEDGNESSSSDWDLPDELLHLPGPENAPSGGTRAAELNTPAPAPGTSATSTSSSSIHTCPTCNKTFKGNNKFIEHARTHTGEKPYGCTVCGRKFALVGNLNSHLKTHESEKRFKCNECNKTFARSSGLEFHKHRHTGVKPLLCETCGRGFSNLTKLNVHVKTHSDTESYSCPQCGKTYKQRGNLNTHMHTHSNSHARLPIPKPERAPTVAKTFSCLECNKVYKAKRNLLKHKEIHLMTSEGQFSCPSMGCVDKFSYRENLRLHIASMHPGIRW